MESDYNVLSSTPGMSNDMIVINQLFQNLASQNSMENNKLQEQIRVNEHHVSSEFQQII
jgi:hypothetical protein